MNEAINALHDPGWIIGGTVVIACLALFFFAFSARGRSFRAQASAARIIVMAVVTSSAVGLMVAFVLFTKQAPPIVLASVFGICLVVGLAVAGYIFYVFDLLPKLSRKNMRSFRSVRSTCIYGICLALLIPVYYYFFLSEGRNHYWTGYLAGVIFGIITGPLASGPMKDRIVEGVLIRKRTWEFEFRAYWKSYLILAISLVISYLVASELLHSMDAFFGFIAGLFAGSMMYFFVWVLLYERRHNVRLTIESENS